MIVVKVKKSSTKSVVPYKHYNRDYCYDVVATSMEVIAPNVIKYGLGLCFEPVIDTETR